MKRFFLLFIVLSLQSCLCNREEADRIMISEENKEYLQEEPRTLTYFNQRGQSMDVVFSGAELLRTERDHGHESCLYTTIEVGEEQFSFGISKGNIVLSYTENSITIGNSTVNKYDFINESYDDNLEDIDLNGFQFKNVLVFDSNNNNGTAKQINKVLYSKTHGIEFILFEDGSWYKRVE